MWIDFYAFFLHLQVKSRSIPLEYIQTCLHLISLQKSHVCNMSHFSVTVTSFRCTAFIKFLKLMMSSTCLCYVTQFLTPLFILFSTMMLIQLDSITSHLLNIWCFISSLFVMLLLYAVKVFLNYIGACSPLSHDPLQFLHDEQNFRVASGSWGGRGSVYFWKYATPDDVISLIQHRYMKRISSNETLGYYRTSSVALALYAIWTLPLKAHPPTAGDQV